MTVSSSLADHYLQLANSPIKQGDFAGADIRYSPEYEVLESELEKAAAMHQTDAIDWQVAVQPAGRQPARSAADARWITTGVIINRPRTVSGVASAG